MTRSYDSSEFYKYDDTIEGVEVIISPKKDFYVNTKNGKVKELCKNTKYKGVLVKHTNSIYKHVQILNNLDQLTNYHKPTLFKFH